MGKLQDRGISAPILRSLGGYHLRLRGGEHIQITLNRASKGGQEFTFQNC